MNNEILINDILEYARSVYPNQCYGNDGVYIFIGNNGAVMPKSQIPIDLHKHFVPDIRDDPIDDFNLSKLNSKELTLLKLALL